MSNATESQGQPQQQQDDFAFVATTLLERFFEVSTVIVDHAAHQDGPLKTTEHFDRLQAGLVVLARHDRAGVVRSLESWSAQKIHAVSKLGDAASVVTRKRVAIEMLYLGTVLRLLREQILMPQANAQKLQERAFHFIQEIDRFVAQQELAKQRGQLVTLCREILKELSRLSLVSVAMSFQAHLERQRNRDAPMRPTAVALCQSMRSVRLPLQSNRDLEAAVDVLPRLSPLQPLIKDLSKKSVLQHAMCETLTDILRAASADGLPMENRDRLSPQRLEAFYEHAHSLFAAVASWAAKKKKNEAAGVTLATQLQCICLQRPVHPIQELDAWVDKMHKWVKDKLFSNSGHRALALDCLADCAVSFAHVQHCAGAADADGTVARLSRMLEPVLAIVQKASYSSSAEQLASLQRLCVGCMPHVPGLTVRKLLVGLLDAESIEVVLVGLRATLEIMLRSTQRLLQAVNLPESKPIPEEWLHGDTLLRMASNADISWNDGTVTGVAPMISGQHAPPDAMARALDLVRRGSHPLDMYSTPHLLAHITKPLDKVMATCWQLQGGRLRHSVSSLASNSPSAKTQLALDALLNCLALMPICELPSWTGEGGRVAAERLALLTTHTSRAVRQQAHTTQLGLIRGRPAYRNAVVAEMCALAQKIPWDPDAHHSLVEQVLALMQHWQDCLTRERELVAGERGVGSGAEALDVAHFEGFAILTLCAPLPRLRKLGVRVLNAVRALHMASVGDPGEPLPERMYVATVLEQAGDTVALENYFNFGTYSDLWRATKVAPASVTLLRVLCATDAERWAALLPRLHTHLATLCPHSVGSAYAQVSAHMSTALRTDMRSLSIPLERNERLDLWRLYVTFLAACAPYPAIKRPVAVMSADELRSHLVAILKGDVEVHIHVAQAALGSCHAGHLAAVLEEVLPAYSESVTEAARRPGRSSRGEDMRLAIAHIVRLSALNLPHGHLLEQPQLGPFFADFLDTTMRHVAHTPSGMFWEVQELQYCAAATAAAVCAQARPGQAPPLPAETRARLWDACKGWLCLTESFRTAPDLTAAVARERARTLDRVRDLEHRSAMDREMQNCVDALRLCAVRAMAALLNGPAWDGPFVTPNGQAFSWCDAMFTGPRRAITAAPPVGATSRVAIARFALRQLLLHNPALTAKCLDRCYSSEIVLAREYFCVFADVAAALHASGDCVAAPQELLALVLAKLIDADADVRQRALDVLRVLADGQWSPSTAKSGMSNTLSIGSVASGAMAKASAPNAVVLGQLPSSYRAFQSKLSAQLAAEHPDLSWSVCLEILRRQAASVAASTQHHVLLSVTPWIANLELNKKWAGTPSEDLLNLMYGITEKRTQHGSDVRELWLTATKNASNFSAILDFVLSRVVTGVAAGPASASKAPLAVAQQVMLFCAEQAAQLAIDELVAESAQLVSEDASPDASASRQLSARDLDDIPSFSLPVAAPPAGIPDSAANDNGQGLSTAPSLSASLPPLPPNHTRNLSASAQSALTSMWQSAASPTPSVTDRSTDLMSSYHAGGFSAGSTGTGRPMLTTADRFPSNHSRSRNRSMGDGSVVSMPRPTSAQGRDAGNLSMMPSAHISRAEAALCLLSELALHHEAAFREHLPVVLLVCIIKADASVPLVHEHAQQMLTHLVYAMSAQALAGSGMAGAQEAVANVIWELQSASAQPLWPAEVTALEAADNKSYPTLRRLVQRLVDCIFFEAELQVKWCEEALNWAMHVPSLALAQRCMHVARALRPALSPSIVSALLSALLQCCTHPSPVAFDFMAEVLLAVRELFEAAHPQQAKMYPHLFWGVLALLQAVHVPLFVLILRVFVAMLGSLQLWNIPCQQILQVSAPQPLPGAPVPAGLLTMQPWAAGCHLTGQARLCCVQQLLWKGLLHASTRLDTIVALTRLLQQLATCLSSRGTSAGITVFKPGLKAALSGAASPAIDGMAQLLGKCSQQFVASFVGGLPWVLVHRSDRQHRAQVEAFCAAAAAACSAFGAAELAPRITALAAGADAAEPLSENPTQVAKLLQNIARPFIHHFFPAHAALTLMHCTAMLLVGAEEYHAAYLLFLKSLFQASNLELGSYGRSDAHLSCLRTLVLLLEGGKSVEVLEMLDVVLDHLASAVAAGRAGGGAPSQASGSVGESRTTGTGDTDRVRDEGGAAEVGTRELLADFMPIGEGHEACKAMAAALQECVTASRTSGGGQQTGWAQQSRFLPFVQ